MAAGNNSRDVRLGIEIETAGEGDVRRLAESVRALAREGDPAAAEYQRLADQLDRLARQGDAVGALQTLTSDVRRLAAAETEAAVAAAAVTARYREQQGATQALRESQVLATAEANEAKAAYIGLVAELGRQVTAGKAAGLSQKELSAATEEARLNVVNQREALERRNLSLVEANAALRSAATAEARLASQFERTQTAAGGAVAALDAQRRALDAAQVSAVQLGLDFLDLDGAQRNLAQSTASAVTEAARLEAAEREGAAAMDLLRQTAVAADAQMEALAASLRQTEAAARDYVTATERAAAAGADDATAVQQRVRAADALIASERELTVAQRQVSTERDRNRASLLAEAQALLQQTRALEASRAATGALVRESITLGTALDGTGRSIGRVGELTERAFGQTGVRSLQAIEAEISDVDRAMSLLERRFRSGQIGANDLARATGSAQTRIAALKREAETVPGTFGAFERISTSINSLISRFGALGAAIGTVGVAVKPVLDATVALQQMQRVLATVTGSAEEAQRQIDFLRSVSQRSGQQFDELGASYAKFAASALQSGLTIGQTQQVFESIALAAGNLGLSSDQAKRALEALSQIASKGTVTMEELRQQLGDALPGVLPLLAKELGLTQAQLNKVVESGQLLATEAIPAIGRAMRALQSKDGNVEGMVASWNRFVNVVKQAGVSIVEGPLGSAAGIVLKTLDGAVRLLATTATGASEAMRLLGLTTLSVLDVLRGDLTFKQFGDQIKDFALESAERLRKFQEIAGGAAAGAKTVGAEIEKLGSSFAKLALDQQTAIDAAVLGAQVAEKGVQARKAEADAITTNAALLGDEATQRRAAAAAADVLLVATEKQLAADRNVVASLEAAKAATIAKATAEGIGLEAIKATVEKLDEKITKAAADVDKTQAQATAARAHAAAMGLSSDALRDNSGRLDELREALESTTAAQIAVARRFAEGKATLDDVRKASEAVAKAKGLLRDAIDDVSEALERELALLRADVKLAEASIKLDLERAKNVEREALAMGRETAARQAGIRVKELELALTRTGSDLKLQEAAATLRALDTQQQELKLLGQLTPAKLADIEAKRKTAQASVLEAQASVESNRGKEKDIELTRQGGTARADYNRTVSDGAKALDGDTTSIDRNSDARRKNNEVVRSQITVIKDLAGELRNAQNAADSAASDAARKARNDAALSGGNFDDLPTGANSRLTTNTVGAMVGKQFLPAGAKYREPGNPAAGFYYPQVDDPATLGQTPQQIVAAEQARLAAVKTSFGANAPAPAPQPTMTTKTVNVTLNFGGSSATLHGTQSEADAFLRLLEEAKRSAGGGG